MLPKNGPLGGGEPAVKETQEGSAASVSQQGNGALWFHDRCP